MSFGERLKEFIDFKRMNIRSFEIKSTLKNGTIYRVVKNNTSLNGDSITAIGKKWSDLNLNWLLLGEGEMLKTGYTKNKLDKESKSTGYSNDKRWDKDAQLDRALDQIELQNEMINLLKHIIEKQKTEASKVGVKL